jgi:hypothetical protein
MVLPQVTYLAAERSDCESCCMIYDARHDKAFLHFSHFGGLEDASCRSLSGSTTPVNFRAKVADTTMCDNAIQ